MIIVFSCSAEMSAGQVQIEVILHTCWMHHGGSEPISASSTPVFTRRNEGVSLCSPATGTVFSSHQCVPVILLPCLQARMWVVELKDHEPSCSVFKILKY